MTSSLFSADPQEALAKLPGSPELAAFRRAQMAAFHAAGLPTTRQEDWRYTSLAEVSAGAFEQPDPPQLADPELARLVDGLDLGLGDAGRLVFVDGFFASQWSRLPSAPGLQVKALGQSLAGGHLPPRLTASDPSSALAALNGAWLRDGAVISAEAGCSAPPIYLLFVAHSEHNLAVQPRVLLTLGAGARVTLIQHYAAHPAARGWLNTVLEGDVGDQAKLTLTTVQENAAAQTHTSVTRLALGRDAELTLAGADLGGRLTRHDINVELRQPGAAVDMFGLFFPRTGQHMDIHTRIDHLAPDTNSREAYRGMAGERGRGVFNGKVVVHPNAQRITAQQSSNNLLLGERCEIDTKPELQIYADDVQCSHGATVGELDHDALFYLLSRGLSEGTARGLLTHAFANEIVSRLAPDALRRHVATEILGAIPELDLDEQLTEGLI